MKTTRRTLQALKERGEPIAMLTCYDYCSAKILDRAGIPLLLVGDSLGMVVLGGESTLEVTLEDMIRCARAVRRGAQNAMVVVDLPFAAYSPDNLPATLDNAARLMRETGAEAVKLEGGQAMVPAVRALTTIGIPVMGHLGLTPQSVHQFGGYHVQGRRPEAAQRLCDDAKALEAAGAFAVVVELVPATTAGELAKQLHIPVIGIGAGPFCDGQVQVFHDLLGLYDDFAPRHAKNYAQLGREIRGAAEKYLDEVRRKVFPGPEHSFDLPAANDASQPSAGASGAPPHGEKPDAAPSPRAPGSMPGTASATGFKKKKKRHAAAAGNLQTPAVPPASLKPSVPPPSPGAESLKKDGTVPGRRADKNRRKKK